MCRPLRPSRMKMRTMTELLNHSESQITSL